MTEMQWRRLRAWVLAQIQQPSTWRGLVWVITATGLAVSPEHQAAIIAGGMFLAGAIGAMSNDA